MKTLKKIQTHIIVIVLCGSFFIPVASFAATSEENLASFVEILNEIRLDPFARAESLGYDRKTLEATCPWLKASYAPLELDLFLCARADALNSLEGDIPEPDISAVNDYARTGEAGGAVVFFNFLSQKTVFQMIVDNILKRELNPDRVGSLNLLDSDFTRVGIAIRAGIEIVDGKKQNAYFVTVCFGSFQLRSAVQVLNLVNQVRSQPHRVSTYLGESSDASSSKRDKGFAPLMNRSVLHGSAQRYSKQVVDELMRLTPVSYLPSDPFVRAVDDGYDGLDVDEITARRTLLFPDYEASSQVAEKLFWTMLDNEIKGGAENARIFSQKASEAGVGLSIVAAPAESWGKFAFAAAVLDVGTAVPDGDEQADIYGVIYSDLDENMLYSPGEEPKLPATVKVYRKSDDEFVTQVVTDLAGHFTLHLDPGEEYVFTSSTIAGEIADSREVRIAGDLFLPICLPVPVADPQE